MTPGRDTVERIRRHEVSRALKKVNVSPEEAEIIDLLSRALVGKLLDGPISEVLARAEAGIPFASRPRPIASRGLERYGGADITSELRSNHRTHRNGNSHNGRESEIGGDQVSSKSA